MLRARFEACVRVERGICRLPHGDLHYRASGEGPVVLALHESPRSSLSLLPLLEVLCGRFRVIAPDTPGYGLSDPLPGPDPDLGDFAATMVQLLDALGVERAALYGAHTGAAIACVLAAAAPGRITAVALDGLSAFTPEEVEAFAARYLAAYDPAWDGSHVTRLWSRVRDLHTWFPWYEQSEGARLSQDPSDLEPHSRTALGFIQSGPNYPKAYIRAAAFQPGPMLERLAVPVTVMARPEDLIADHLGRLPQGAGSRIVRLAPGRGAWARALEAALAGAPTAADDAPQTLRPGSGVGVHPAVAAGPRSHLEAMGAGYLHLVQAGASDGPLRVVIADPPGDLKALVTAEAERFPGWRILGVDPPGCGRSDPLITPARSLADFVEPIRAALAGLRLKPHALAGFGVGALVMEVVADRVGARPLLQPVDPPIWTLDPDRLPSLPLLDPLAPRWDGAHLGAAWMQLRDLGLYDVPPACGRPARRARPELDPKVLQARFRSFVEGPESATVLDLAVADVRRRNARAHARAALR